MAFNSFTRREYLKLMGAAGITTAIPQRGDRQTDRRFSLWYRQPASQWVEALPIGNGRLGAMIYGGVAGERVQLNEDSIWAGERRDRNNPKGGAGIVEVRRLLREGRIAEAEDLAGRTIISVPSRLPPYQPLGELKIDLAGPETFSEYVRDLDLGNGLASVSYRIGEARYDREYLATAVDGVIAMRFTCDKPGGLSFSATLVRESDSRTKAGGNGELILEGEAIARGDRYEGERKVGVRFASVLRVRLVGSRGKVRTEGERLIVDGATEVILLLAAATSQRVKEPLARCRRDLDGVRSGYAAIRAAHVADHKRLYDRVGLDLTAERMDHLPTDERLKRVQGGATDIALEALLFQYGRYLLIASSRPGSMAANLQGIWNDLLSPPWESKYTININTEMNYWPAETTGLSELQEPLFDLLESAIEDGRRVARNLYGARGFVVHHNTDGWGHAVPIDGVGSGIWPMGGAWLSLHFWDHYDFTCDREFLARRAWPVMREAAEFLLDVLFENERGELITGPSISPENRYRTKDGQIGRLCLGPSMDIQIAYALFSRVLEAGELLGLDAGFRERVATARGRLPKPKIGRFGQLQEWQEDYEEADPGHRHISHLFALHPGNQITLRGTPELARAARVTLERRLRAGSGHTGWSRSWIINFWSRLEDGEQAHHHIVELLRSSTYINLFDRHPPFQIDGNFGATAGIAEMLLQSHAGELSLLPALPAAWPSGRVSGLRARGAIGVGIVWKDGALVEATLEARKAGEVKLRVPHGRRIASISAAGRKLPVGEPLDGAVTLRLPASGRYRITFS